MPTGVFLRRITPAIERFLPRFTVSQEYSYKGTACWLWTGTLEHGGYGNFSVFRDCNMAHRFSYQFFKGAIPKGLCIDHLCRNRSCVNPDHLEVVTLRENIKRGIQGSRMNAIAVRQLSKTHCPQGHPYDEKNTYHNIYGRHCRMCGRIAAKAKRERVKAVLGDSLTNHRQIEGKPED